jgi:hypothetical protein
MPRAVDSAHDVDQRDCRLTVAQVRPHADGAAVTFFESARIYRLLRRNPDYNTILRRLRQAVTARTPVCVRFVEPNGGVIESVRADY